MEENTNIIRGIIEWIKNWSAVMRWKSVEESGRENKRGWKKGDERVNRVEEGERVEERM